MESRWVYVQRDDVEPLIFYRQGGYHPVHIDDVFQDRYRVVDKLGFGTFATVWLVKDLTTGRWAALKILVANAPQTTSELDVLRHLKRAQEADKSSLGQEFVMRFFDDFQIEGPNGIHQCLVTELLGPSLASASDMYICPQFPIDVAKPMSAQLARGVDYLHSQRIIHGDLHLENILLQIPRVDSWSEEEVRTYFGEPFCEPIVRRDGQPLASDDCKHLPRYQVVCYETTKLAELCLSSVETVQVKISDLGQAFLWDGKPKVVQLGTPCFYAAPEVIFNDAISPATDIWALAVLIHMILGSLIPLFYSYYGDESEVILSMVKALGKFPERWWTKWEGRSQYFDEAGTYIGKPGDYGGTTWIRARLDPLECEEFERIIRKMVCYEPQDRIGADQVAHLLSSLFG